MKQEEKYFLHGDTGVHNFVFRQNQLVGVIDPDPMAGPVIYDFTYAFCSSPDDLDMETLLDSFALLKNVRDGYVPLNRRSCFSVIYANWHL